MKHYIPQLEQCINITHKVLTKYQPNTSTLHPPLNCTFKITVCLCQWWIQGRGGGGGGGGGGGAPGPPPPPPLFLEQTEARRAKKIPFLQKLSEGLDLALFVLPGNVNCALLAELLQTFLDTSRKRKWLIPLPDLSRKINGESVSRVFELVERFFFSQVS